MKSRMLFTLTMFMTLTAVSPSWAQEESAELRTGLDSEAPLSPSDYNMHLNPQIGVSSFEFSGPEGGSSKQQLSGGLTVELGRPSRKMETGVLLMRTDSAFEGEQIQSTYLTLPMMAKLRVIALRAQSWYTKFGVIPAFQLSSSRDAETNNIDVIGSLGVGGRMPFTRKMDFVVEASYNRGLLDAVRGQGSNYNQGFLVLAGVSIRI